MRRGVGVRNRTRSSHEDERGPNERHPPNNNRARTAEVPAKSTAAGEYLREPRISLAPISAAAQRCCAGQSALCLHPPAVQLFFCL